MPRLLDLCCGGGGCSEGYVRAGFDVVGVDIDARALAEYPYPCVLADLFDVLNGHPLDGDSLIPPVRDVELDDDGVLDLDQFDVIHASPPCQEYSITRNSHDHPYPRLVEPLLVCGSEWPLWAYDDADNDHRELRLRRHRLFSSNVPLTRKRDCRCDIDRGLNRIGGVYGGGSPDRSQDNPRKSRGGYTPAYDVRRAAHGDRLDRQLRRPVRSDPTRLHRTRRRATHGRTHRTHLPRVRQRPRLRGIRPLLRLSRGIRDMMKPRPAWHAIFTSYPCPTCGAPAGDDCHTRSGSLAVIPHAARTHNGDRCRICGTLLNADNPGDLCPRHELIRSLEIERATRHPRRR